MARLEWNTDNSGRYISGVSHGVFYGDDGKGIPWNGLISVTEKHQANEPTPVYNSLGHKYDLHGNIAEKRNALVCYTYPEEMDEYLGHEYLEEYGFSVDERPPRKFNMVYRSECDGYYELHVLLGQIATFGDVAHTTDSATPGISNITMNLQGVSHEVYGSSHLIFDSRNPITGSAERLLYGTRNSDANFNRFLDAEVEWIFQAANYAPTIEPDYENPVVIDSVPHPGIKNSSKWNQDNLIVYWDEFNERMMLRSTAENEGVQSKLSIPIDIGVPSDIRTRVDLNFGEIVEEGAGRNYLLNSYSGDALSIRPNDTNVQTLELGVDDLGEYLTSVRVDNGNFEVDTYVEQTFDSDVFSEELSELGGIFTQSVEVMSSEPLRVRLGNGDTNAVELEPNVWTRIEDKLDVQTLTRPSGIYTDESSTAPSETKLYYRKWKIEPGDVATFWTAAPEDGLCRRIIGTRDPQVVSSKAPNRYGTHTVELVSTVSSDPHIEIYHNGLAGSEDVAVDNLIVTLQDYRGDFFDGNSKPNSRGERYTTEETTAGYQTVYEHLLFRTPSEIELRLIGTDIYELEAPETHLTVRDDEFTFRGDQITQITNDVFEIDDNTPDS